MVDIDLCEQFGKHGGYRRPPFDKSVLHHQGIVKNEPFRMMTVIGVKMKKIEEAIDRINNAGISKNKKR